MSREVAKHDESPGRRAMRVLMVSIGGLLAAFGSGCLTLGAVYWAAVGLDLLPTLLIGGVLPLAGGIALIRRARRNR